MSGFHAEPDGIEGHATQVKAIGEDVGNGASAEVAGTAQANFGVLIGNTLGFGIRGLAEHFESALKSAADALDATASQLHGTAQTYRDAEAASQAQITSSGGGP